MEAIGGLLFVLALGAVGVASLWFWIWALVDAARGSKVGWVAAIALTQVFGAGAHVVWGRRAA